MGFGLREGSVKDGRSQRCCAERRKDDVGRWRLGSDEVVVLLIYGSASSSQEQDSQMRPR